MGAEIKNIPIQIGDRFGRLEILDTGSINRIKNFRTEYLCKCDCGNIKKVSRQNLLKGRSKSCGCLRRELSSSRNTKDSFHVACGTILRQYKSTAKSRGISFSLTKDELKLLVSRDCFYCGRPPSNMVNIFNGRHEHKHPPVFYNGIDRLDNNKGYEKDNCVPCCPMCNWSKKDLTVEQFYSWIDSVYKNLSKSIKEPLKDGEIDVSNKGTGLLVDDLCTTSQKLWHLQEIHMDNTSTDTQIADAFRKIQTLNVRRNALINAIDSRLNPTIASTSLKTYK